MGITVILYRAKQKVSRNVIFPLRKQYRPPVVAYLHCVARGDQYGHPAYIVPGRPVAGVAPGATFTGGLFSCVLDHQKLIKQAQKR